MQTYLPTLLLLLVAGLALLYISISFIVQIRLPSDGMLLSDFSPDGLSVATQLVPVSETLAVGDELLSVEGRTIWEWGERSWKGAPPPAWQVGQTLIYRIRRHGVIRDIPVTLRFFPWGRLPLMRLGVYGLALLSLVVTSYILLRRPGDTAAQLFFDMALFLSITVLLHTQIMTIVVPWLFVTESILRWLSRAFLFSAVLHLFAIFPVRRHYPAIVRDRLWLLHLVNPCISLVVGLIFKQSSIQRWALITRASTWIGLVMLMTGIGNLIYTYLTERHPATRGQIRWIAWGSFVGIVPYFIFTGLPEALSGRPILTIEITAFFLVALPITIGIAVARYRLFDVDVLIWKTLAYTLLLLLMVGLYFAFYGVIARILQAIVVSVRSTTIVFVSTLLVTSIFWILRPVCEHYANRFLYRTHLHPQQLLAQMTEAINSTLKLDQLAVLFSDVLPQKIGATHGSLMVLSEDGQALALVGEPSFRLTLDIWFKGWEEHDYKPVLRSNPPSSTPLKALKMMAERDIELVVPLQIGNNLVGLLSLGPRVGMLSYTTAELNMLQLLAHQAALAVQNALLVRQMEAQQRYLQQEVEQRTEVMTNDRNRLNAILQNMADALLVTDQHGIIRLVNPSLENLMRRSARMLMGKPISHVIPLPDLLPTIERALEHPGIIETLHTTLQDPRLALLDDTIMEERVLNISVTALRDRSTVICILRDITREVEIDRMKSEFISTVSHELRTPLTAIMGFTKLSLRSLERSILPKLSDDQQRLNKTLQRTVENLGIVVQEGERLANLVSDILDIAELDAGKIDWQDQPCDIVAITQRVLDSMRDVASQKQLLIHARFEENLPKTQVDPKRIQQIISNLLSNAIKFTEQGEITVEVRRLPAQASVNTWQAPAEGGILLSVKDTGVGISSKEMQRLFERFTQGGDTLLNKPEGTGLGLAICHEIVMHYAGAIWAESELEVGSIFYVALPIIPAPPEDLTDTSNETLDDPHATAREKKGA